MVEYAFAYVTTKHLCGLSEIRMLIWLVSHWKLRREARR